MIISLYILRRYFISFIQVALFVSTLIFLVDLFEKFAQFSSRDVPIGRIFIYCILRLGDNFLQFLPLIVLLSSLFCFSGLSRTSEIVILRAAGIPATRFVFLPVAAIFVLGVLIITLLNPIYVGARTLAQNYENQFLGRGDEFLGFSRTNGLWLRSHSDEGVQIYRMQNVNWQQEILRDVTVYIYGDGDFRQELTSKNARIEDGEWVLNGVTEVTYDEDITTKNFAQLRFPAQEGFEEFFSEYYSPRYLKNSELPKYIEELESDNYDTKDAKGYYYSELASPIMLMSLCLIGAIFALAPDRMGGTMRRLLYALLLGFGVYGFARLSQSMGVAGTIPVWISVIIVPITSMFVAFSVLLRQEDG